MSEVSGMPLHGDGQLLPDSSAQLCQGTVQKGKQPRLIPRHTLGPEAVVRGWAACPHGGREERVVTRVLHRHKHRISSQGSQWKKP